MESAGNIASAAILTGPEGGLEPFEAELARIMKLHICSMGPRIFRCETAPVAALSALMYATGNMYKTPIIFQYISSNRPRKSIAFSRAFCYNTFHQEHLLLTQGHLTNQRKKAMP